MRGTVTIELSDDEQAVWDLEVAYWEYAKAHDIPSYRTLWDENFVGWPGFSKTPLGKQNIGDWIPPLHGDATRKMDFSLTRKAIRSFGDVVVVHYLVRTFFRSSETGEELPNRPSYRMGRITHTWQRRGDSWQIITGMSGKLVSDDESK